MDSEANWVITVDKEDVTETELRKLEDLVREGEVKDYNSDRNLIRDVRSTYPGTTLCSGVETVTIVSGAITIFSASVEVYSAVQTYLEENDIKYRDITTELIRSNQDEATSEDDEDS